MVSCLNCGKEFDFEVKLCPNCGTVNNLDYPEGDSGYTYKVRRNILERMFLVLFDKKARADIIMNPHTGETIFVYFLVLVLNTIPNILFYLTIRSRPNSNFIGNQALINFLFSLILYNLVINAISPFLLAAFTLIGNSIANTHNTYSQIFRLIVFMEFPITIIILLVNYGLNSQIYAVTQFLNLGIYSFGYFIYFLQILIVLILMPIGFKTLFECRYLKAFFIFFISSLIVNILSLVTNTFFAPRLVLQ